ncbi:MAG: 4Fe-4S dicluster domain-containing protein [Thermoplasmata archaeon]
MRAENIQIGKKLILQGSDFSKLFVVLKDLGYTIIGPTIHNNAIVYDKLNSVEDLPIGITDVQGPGYYRLEKRGDKSFFGYNVGPQNWKKYLYPPHQKLWSAHRSKNGITFQEEKIDDTKYAFLGLRACEISAIALLDKVFIGQYTNQSYYKRRINSLYIAVQCGQAGNTCFCSSMGTGPRITNGYDILLTEILKTNEHKFLLEIGTDKGVTVASGLPLEIASEEDIMESEKILSRTISMMGRSVNIENIHDILLNNINSDIWNHISQRCLTCTNCTMVCPTCFCSTTEEFSSLNGEIAEKWIRWDSCFNSSFTQLGKTSVRKSPASRYRQWLMHKFVYWYDQFSTMGCVGCGRCITWCPVGIDLTEVIENIRNYQNSSKEIKEVIR